MTTTNAQILSAITDVSTRLGRVEGTIVGMGNELTGAAASRKGIYEKLEAQDRKMDQIGFEMEKQAGIQGQQRDVLKELADVQGIIARNVQPLLDLKSEVVAVVEVYKTVKKKKRTWLWFITTFSGALLALWWMFHDVLRSQLIKWLISGGLP